MRWSYRVGLVDKQVWQPKKEKKKVSKKGVSPGYCRILGSIDNCYLVWRLQTFQQWLTRRGRRMLPYHAGALLNTEDLPPLKLLRGSRAVGQ